MGKQMGYIHEYYSAIKRKKAPQMDDSKHYANRKKADTKEHI